MPLTLLVPDLLPPADATAAMRALRLPHLEKWLARGTVPRAAGTRDDWLLRQWGLGAEAPVAALALAAEGAPVAGTWMHADPVHQRVERHALVLEDAGALELTAAEVAAAIAALNDFFARDGLQFQAPSPTRWYVRIPDGEAPRTVALDEAIGRNPFGMIPKGEGRLAWPALFSEAQMLLAALPCNAQREAQGRPALNGLWFWGAGALPGQLPRPFARVFADDSLARGLAQASGCRLDGLPATLLAIDAGDAGDSLVVLDALRGPLRRAQADAWIAAARALERDWFSALGQSLPERDRVRLVLPGPRDTLHCEVSPRSRWRLFARARALAAHG